MFRAIHHLLLLLLLACVLPAQATEALRLGDEVSDVDAWPAVTLLSDPGGTMRSDDVLQQLSRFTPPPAAHANLGVRRDVVWLRVPVFVPERADGRWLLDIDFATLDDIRVFVVSDGLVVREAALGDRLTMSERVAAARSHVLPLVLEAGLEHELLLRVQTSGSMIVPLRLMKAAAFHTRESRTHLVQGLAGGIALCLLMYAVAHTGRGRDPMFLYYAGTVASVGMFFFAFHGFAALTLWPEQRWLIDRVPMLMLLLGMAFGLPLIERLLDVRSLSAWLARVMLGVAALAGGIGVLFVAGVIGYSTAHFAVTLMGPLPVMLALPVAWARWRSGDAAAPYLFAGWAVYGLGMVVMVALARGWVDSNPWTQNAFQAGSMFEMLMWLRVLGVRNDQARQRAERADHEREVLQALAHTDALTGLPNRRGLETELATAVSRATPQRLLAVYLLDLDGFKAVNDRLGHDAGDELLVAVAARLRGELRHSDVVARLGGDEFVVLAPGLPGEAEAWQLGRKIVTAFGQPFTVRGQICSVGITAGFALAPLDGQDASSLLRRADAAMYAGKQSGKSTVRRGAASVGLAVA